MMSGLIQFGVKFAWGSDFKPLPNLPDGFKWVARPREVVKAVNAYGVEYALRLEPLSLVRVICRNRWRSRTTLDMDNPILLQAAEPAGPEHAEQPCAGAPTAGTDPAACDNRKTT